jgi:hypothetical protein
MKRPYLVRGAGMSPARTFATLKSAQRFCERNLAHFNRHTNLIWPFAIYSKHGLIGTWGAGGWQDKDPTG